MDISNVFVEIAKTSFRQTLGTLSFFNDVEIQTQNKLVLSSKEYFSVMTTVSASKFRMTVLLHTPIFTQGGNSLSKYMIIDDKLDQNKQYIDHAYEYSNNLCGMCARHIQASGFTTGISQPAILNRAYTDVEIAAISPSYKAHVTSKLHGKTSLCASMCLFLNNEDINDITLKVEDEEEFNDVSGELEFF